MRWIEVTVVSAKKLRHNQPYEELSTISSFLRLAPVLFPLPKSPCGQSAGKEDESDAEKLSGTQESDVISGGGGQAEVPCVGG